MKAFAWSVFIGLILLPARATAKSDSLESLIAATPEYDLNIHVMPDSHRMEVAGTLRFQGQSKPRTEIELNLSELMKDVHVTIVEPAENAGSADLIKEEKKDSTEHFVRWQLRPKKPLPANKPVKLSFSYSGGEGTDFVFYIGPEGSFAGGANTVWYLQLDDADSARGTLKFSIPVGYTVLATGKNSGTPAEEAKGNFVFEDKVPGQFSFAAGKYTVLERKGIVPMRAYLLHPRSNVEAYLDGSSKILTVLSKEFGPYPYAEFAIAEVPSAQAFKAGFSGASFNGFMLSNKEFLDKAFNLAYYGHEIGHQWWGNAVIHGGEPGGHDYLLDEAMAQFGSLRVVEAIDGKAAAEEYRRSGYPGYSPTQCGYGYLRSVKAGKDHALGSLPVDPNSHELADSKGFLVWDMLSRMVGPERFSQALHAVTQKYQFRTVHWQEVVDTVQSVSHEDLGWFFSQWLDRTSAPDFKLTWKQEGGAVHGEITQADPFYRVQIELQILGTNNESVTQTLDVKSSHMEFNSPVSFHVQSVVLDPHFYILHWVPDISAVVPEQVPLQVAVFPNLGSSVLP